MRKLLMIFSLSAILIITGCKNEGINSPVVEEQKNFRIFSEEVINNVIIRNHNVAYYDNIYHVYLDIVNENNVSVDYSTILINYYNDAALIYSAVEEIKTIPANSSIDISFDIDINLINANKVEYVIK